MTKKNESRTYEEKLEKSLVPDWEQPYKVPSNWIWTRLGALITEVKNGTTIKQDKTLDGFNVTRIESLQQQTIDFNRLGVIVDESKIKDSDWYEKGDIALSHINSAEHVGKTAMITEDMLPLVHGMNLLRLRFNTLFEPKLFQLFSQSFQYKQAVIERINMAVNQVSINQKQLCTIEVPLPPVAEQQRIVERIESLFSKLDEAKEKAQMALDSFENRKAAILHKAFSGELSKKWREENGMSLGSWEKIPFEKIIESGPQNGLYKPQSAYGSGIKIIRIDSFYNGDIEPWSTIKQLQLVEAEINTYKLEVGDILVNRVNSMPYLGKSALVRELPEICVFESNIMRLSLDTKKALPEYIICYLNSSIGLEELKKNAKQAVNQASINQQDVKSAMISLPTVPEQLEIVRILDSIFGKERQAKEFVSVIDKIDHMKKAILARAFRGELGTNNPEEESALELLKEILSGENKTKEKQNKKTITIPSHILKQFKTDLEEQIYRIILENQKSALNQILSSISSSKHLDAMEVITILYEKGLIKEIDNLYSTK